jgi:hypothetical protein
MTFRNPANGYEEQYDQAWLWCLLFGGFYFAAKGIWTHAVVGLGLAVMTVGLSWFVYPFFAEQIVRRHYLRRGWTLVVEPAAPAATPHKPVGMIKNWKWWQVALAIFAIVVAARMLNPMREHAEQKEVEKEAPICCVPCEMNHDCSGDNGDAKARAIMRTMDRLAQPDWFTRMEGRTP